MDERNLSSLFCLTARQHYIIKNRLRHSVISMWLTGSIRSNKRGLQQKSTK